MYIKKKNKSTTVIGKEKSPSYLMFDNRTHSIVDFNESWNRNEIRTARELLKGANQA